MFPGFRPTPEEWRSVENALRARYEDLPRKRGSHLSTLPDDITLWSGKDLLTVLMEPPAVVDESIQHVKKDSRRGTKIRACGLTCEGMLSNLAETDATVVMLTPPGVRERMVTKWGEKDAFSIRTIQDEPLYIEWRQAVMDLRKKIGKSGADFLGEGFAILSHKPGREDKRREGGHKAELAVRTFLATIENANIEAKRQIAARLQNKDKKSVRNRGNRQ